MGHHVQGRPAIVVLAMPVVCFSLAICAFRLVAPVVLIILVLVMAAAAVAQRWWMSGL